MIHFWSHTVLVDCSLRHFNSFHSISSLLRNIFNNIVSNQVLREFSPFLVVFLVLCDSTRSPILISVLFIPLSWCLFGVFWAFLMFFAASSLLILRRRMLRIFSLTRLHKFLNVSASKMELIYLNIDGLWNTLFYDHSILW